ncbi:LysR family transcriptional regulator [Clostridium swellfunianum]|uniref:LysR family transcriptional regulator n=1 Tax=Clostridium swellfunianum TaxID=1367462 RepID=UPI00202DCD2D|nr:LysR family transcriptional regulator [Clostridium swellfunianum]MCM0650938.1 LysR family transcriptional regulator [Clostridium swellfunianum]
MEFKDIEYALAISKYRHITKAAESLYITQPTLSTYIKNMEKRLDIALFKREGNKIDLTYEGEIFIENGMKILQQRDDLLNKLNESIHSEKGRLKLSIPILRGSYLIPAILPIFHKKYPNVEIILSEATSSEVEKNVKNGVSDLVIFNKPFRKLSLQYETIHKEELLLIMNKNHPLANMGITCEGLQYPWIDIKLCKDEPFIIQFPNQHTGEVERHIFKQAGINPKIALETKNIEASVRLASLGYGLTFVSESHIKHITLPQGTLFFSVGNPTTTMEVVAAYVDKHALSKYAREFIKISKECLSK